MDQADAALRGHPSSGTSPAITSQNSVAGLRAIACCLKQPLMVVVMVIFAISDNFLVWGIHLSLTVKHLHRTSHAGALQSHLVIDPLPRGSKTQAWSSSERLRDEGRIPGAAAGLCSRLVSGQGQRHLLERAWGRAPCPWREAKVPPARSRKGRRHGLTWHAARGIQLTSWLRSTALIVVFGLALGYFCPALIPYF